MGDDRIRGPLDIKTADAVKAGLPNLSWTRSVLKELRLDTVSSFCDDDSKVPVASVNLFNANKVAGEAWFAIYEARAHWIWFNEKKSPPNVSKARGYARFFLDDAALRLYAAQEFLAHAIVNMLELDDEVLQRYSKKAPTAQLKGRAPTCRFYTFLCHKKERKEKQEQKPISRAATVGLLLKNECPKHPLTQAALGLHNQSEWAKTIEYRNKWVHEQPPLVEGVGSSFLAKSAWKEEGESRSLTIGVSDEPQDTVEDLFGFIQPALKFFVETLEAVVSYYLNLLKKQGINVDIEKGMVNISFYNEPLSKTEAHDE
jgi:hypothetical protein